MISGNIDIAFVTLIEAFPFIESGKLKALGIGSAKRSAFLTGVPAIADLRRSSLAD